METRRIAAVVVNDFGHILAYTVQSTMSQCEEEAIKRHGKERWELLKSKGAKIVQCEIVL